MVLGDLRRASSACHQALVVAVGSNMEPDVVDDVRYLLGQVNGKVADLVALWDE